MIALLSLAEVVIAHNAKFDARMLHVIEPALVLDRDWHCTLQRWPWPTLGDKKLNTVCAHYAIQRNEIHSAFSDCEALAAVLFQHTGKTNRSMTYMARLLAYHPIQFHAFMWQQPPKSPRGPFVCNDETLPGVPEALLSFTAFSASPVKVWINVVAAIIAGVVAVAMALIL